ncbi:MAG TPA: mechanosensitive ion channel family protein [Acidimicrobiales bacterium]|jgi:small conductance mechanosensitive channel
MVLQQIAPSQDLVDACGSSPSWACRRIFDATGNSALAGAVDFLLGPPLRILFIVVVAFVTSRLVRRAIRRFTDTISGTSSSDRMHSFRQHAPSVLVATEGSARSAARAQTIGSVLRSLSTAVIYSIAGVTIMGELGVNLGPIVASAGIVGVAVGFGAQSLVKDFLSGVFMLVEDQYGVGDIIDVGEATGTVEGVGLRTTRLRDVNGTVWHVPNGQITRIGNKSQEWARALLDVTVAYSADVREAEAAIKAVADQMWHSDDWRSRLLEEPEIWGVENLGPNGIDIRVGIKTKPSEQFKVMRELRTRIKETLDENDIEMPSQGTVWLRDDGTHTGNHQPPSQPNGAPAANGDATDPSVDEENVDR